MPDPTLDRPCAEPELIEDARLADYIRAVVDTAPSLTPDQRDRLALLLRAGGPDEGQKPPGEGGSGRVDSDDDGFQNITGRGLSWRSGTAEGFVFGNVWSTTRR